MRDLATELGAPIARGRKALELGADSVLARRVHWLCAVLVGVALVGSAVFARESSVASGGDEAAYALAARYDPLVDTFGNPPHGWAYPAAIRLVLPVVGDEYRAGQCISIACCGVFVLAATGLALRVLPFALAALVGLAIATDPTVLRTGGAAMSDMPFAALEATAIWLAFDPSRRAAALFAAGALCLLACFVRGNGVVLPLVLPLLLWADARGRLRPSLLFAAGAAASLALCAALFAVRGLPLHSLVRPGAGELAWVVLDRSGSWLDRPSWDVRFPSYVSLFASHGREMALAAARSLFHLHDWWLLRALGLLGFFTLPGLLLFLRRPESVWLGFVLPFLALWSTFLWHAKLHLPRHLISAMPLLYAASVVGVGVIPRRGRVSFLAKPIPLRACALAIAIALSVARGAYTIGAVVAQGGTTALDLEQRDAGLWLRGHGARPDERIASTRHTTAYYARLRPIDYRDVFPRDDPALSPADVCGRVGASGARWLVWIDGHSEYEHASLAWLAREDSFDRCALVFRDRHVSVWRVDAEPATAQPRNFEKSGVRFSLNAATPSRASGVLTNSSSESNASVPMPAIASLSALKECFSTFSAVGLFASISSAHCRTSARSAAFGTTLFTSPQRSMVAASYSRHRYQTSRARFSPRMRARYALPKPASNEPTRGPAWPKRA
jgi:hypothetical protein